MGDNLHEKSNPIYLEKINNCQKCPSFETVEGKYIATDKRGYPHNIFLISG